MIALLGVIVMLSIAVLFSERRDAIEVRQAARTLMLQILICVLAFRTPPGLSVISTLSNGVQKGLAYTQAATDFVFGPLADASNGFILAFPVLPVIVFVMTRSARIKVSCGCQYRCLSR